jgi:methyl-accepting chemotaxis protein
MNLKVKVKIVLGFSSLLLLMVGLTLVGIFRVNQINQGLQEINDVNGVKLRYVINFRGSVHDRAIEIRDLILVDDPIDRGEIVQTIRNLEEFYRNSAEPLDQLVLDGSSTGSTEAKLLANIKAIEVTTVDQTNQIINLVLTSHDAQAERLLMSQARFGYIRWLAAINEFIDFIEANNNDLSRSTRSLADGFQLFMLITTAIGVVLGLLISFWTIKSVNPLGNIAIALEDIAQGEGDLTKALSVHSKDEIGTVALNFNNFVETLRTILLTVRSSVDGLAETGQGLNDRMVSVQEALEHINQEISVVDQKVISQSEGITEVSQTITQIDANLQQLNQLIGKQAESVQSTTGAVHSMAQLVEKALDGIQKSLKEFEHLNNTAEVGAEILQQVQERVHQIAQQSQGMSEANNVINSIAAQTNLLAMNAAIEAAHAGEAGKGFAVVADEIRKLAESSATQSKTISGTLKQFKKAITLVVESSEQAGKSFQDVQQAIQTVSTEQRALNSTMHQQSEGNRLVLEAFGIIEKLNHQVLAGAEEMVTGSGIITVKTTELVESTHSIEDSVEDMKEESQKISQAIQDVANLSVSTEEGIKQVQGQIQRFVLS